MDPICSLARACMEGDKEKYEKMITSLGIELSQV